MPPTAAKILETSAACIELEVTIHAPPADVWEAVIHEPEPGGSPSCAASPAAPGSSWTPAPAAT